MPHRDPQTGQFVSSPTDFADIEVVTFTGNVGVQAANLSGGTGFSGGDTDDFEGVELIDYDEIVDRNESLVLLQAHHALSVYINSTQTADGTVSAGVAVKADPSIDIVTQRAATPTGTVSTSPDNAVGTAEFDDSIDFVGRVLSAVGYGPFTDGPAGVGGGGSAGEDSYTVKMAPAEFGRFHPRDELFMNGRINVWNVADAGAHVELSGQHVYGVLEE